MTWFHLMLFCNLLFLNWMKNILCRRGKTEVNIIYTQTLICFTFLQRSFGLGMWAGFNDYFSYPCLSFSNNGFLPVPGSSSLSFLKEASSGECLSISHSGNRFPPSYLTAYGVSLQPFAFFHEFLWKQPVNGYKSLIVTVHTQSLAIH